MQILTFEELEAEAGRYDAVVDTSPLPDRFCSASDWLLPALAAFGGAAESAVLRGDLGYAPLMSVRTVLGRTWMPLEASWGLAAPLAGPDPAALAVRFAAEAVQRRADWDALFLSGLLRDGPDYGALVARLGRRFRLGLGQSTIRCVASLEGGADGFLGRRSAKFRKNLRRAERASEVDLRFEVHRPGPAEAPAVFARVLDVERRSWKGQEGHGIDEGAMHDFYARMVPRLAAGGRLRVTFAIRDGDDVGYVLGGVRGDTYRGLQISFDEGLTERSLGNLLQWATVRGLADEGVATYDLGTDMAYKRHWAEGLVETLPLVVR